jgi:hypothetical protein
VAAPLDSGNCLRAANFSRPQSIRGTRATPRWTEQWRKSRAVLPWLPTFVWQSLARRSAEIRPVHLLIGVADHFEPMQREETAGFAVGFLEQERRVARWCREYPPAIEAWRDLEGQPLRHTYFYPAENFDDALVDHLAEFCHAGWGEIEIHLHHGVDAPDTAENTIVTLEAFRDALESRGCLARDGEAGRARYGFVHGNWALANSDHGRYCGVDQEMRILAETGCYADFTLPSPGSARSGKINSIYECGLPLDEPAPHRRGRRLQVGRIPLTFPLIVQGPLGIDLWRRRNGWLAPGIESGELSGANPPSLRRLRLWRDAAICVQGRPDWLFIKLHCHGMISRDEPAMFGASIRQFLAELVEGPGNGTEYQLHFLTMREMVNVALAACAGHQGNPGDYREYRFRRAEAAVRI